MISICPRCLCCVCWPRNSKRTKTSDGDENENTKQNNLYFTKADDACASAALINVVVVDCCYMLIKNRERTRQSNHHVHNLAFESTAAVFIIIFFH